MASIKNTYECRVCSTFYADREDASTCCALVRMCKECDYCEERFSDWDRAGEHLIDGRCPEELSQGNHIS